MRELKFRAWDGKKMLYDIMPVDEHRAANLNPRDQRAFLHGNFIYMQHIGLKDKNGKEIYEGDILDRREIYFESEVVWRGGVFLRKRLGMNEEKFIEQDVNTWVEAMPILLEKNIEEDTIIGNIYENPEIVSRSPD